MQIQTAYVINKDIVSVLAHKHATCPLNGCVKKSVSCK